MVLLPTGPAGDVICPVAHQRPPLVEQVAPHIGRLGAVAHVVGQGRLSHRPRRRRLLHHPVAEAGPETVGYRGDLEPPEQGGERHLGGCLAAAGGGEDQALPVAEASRLPQYLHSPGGQGDPVGTPGLHPGGRYLPGGRLPVDLGPIGRPHLPGAAGSQDQELEGQLGRSGGSGLPDLPHRPRHLGVGQGPAVFLRPLHRRQHLEQGAPRRVVQPVTLGDRPVHDRLHPLADPAGGLRLGGPDGRQHVQGVGRGDGVDPFAADQRKSVGLKRRLPLGGMLGVAPGGAAQLDHLGGGLGEGGDGRSGPAGRLPGLPLVGNRIPAFGNGGAVVVGYGARLGQADGGIRPQAQVAAASVNHDSLDPGLAPRKGRRWGRGRRRRACRVC